MNPISLIFICINLILNLNSVIGQFDYCKFQEEYKQKIINLSDSEIESEYEKIHLDDQALRGGEASKENDYKNLIKISCLVSKYGIPTKFMSKEAQMSPSIVIIHAPQIFTYSFLKYYKEAYENGKIEESKFHFFLFACYKAIFDYSFVDTKDNDMQQEIEMILERISKNKPDMMFSLDNICKAIIEFEDNLMYKDYKGILKAKNGHHTLVIRKSRGENYILYSKYEFCFPTFYEIKRINDTLFVPVHDYNYSKWQVSGKFLEKVDTRSNKTWKFEIY